eukprot:TRINITY_DN14753_c1_g4_i1.p1 TRINITY_DN14753_c1_g4~~TRINITY_DN14753_c1_g4_i1.p1  ORF type:complete len:456 (+),score=22.60 TRINITY_DN14753_c1_g4_i1:62-1429(+)
MHAYRRRTFAHLYLVTFLVLNVEIADTSRTKVVSRERLGTAVTEADQLELTGAASKPGGSLPAHTCVVRNGHIELEGFVQGQSIGQGRFGSVYAARLCNSTTWDHAVKRMYYCPATTEKCDREKRSFDPVEIEPMKLKLPFVATYDRLYYDPELERVSLLMPIFHGGTLFNHVYNKKHLPTIEQAMNWGRQVAYGLWQLHRKGFLYGDLKLENTLVIDDEPRRATRLVLSDFGVTTENCKGACTNRRQGTIHNIAPSIADGEPYGIEVDWWAHAVMMSRMLGRYPFAHAYRQKRDQEHVAREIRYVRYDLQHLDGYPRLRMYLRSFFGRPVGRKGNDNPCGLEPLFRWLSPPCPPERALYAEIRTDQGRKLLATDRASQHPILKNEIWHGFRSNETDKIDAFWYNICETYAEYPENCVGNEYSEAEDTEQQKPDAQLDDTNRCFPCVHHELDRLD